MTINSKRKNFVPSAYADFKVVAPILTSGQYVFYAVTGTPSQQWIAAIEPTSGVSLWTNDGTVTTSASVIPTDFPNAVNLSSYSASSALFADNTFTTDTYNLWKALVNKLNLGGQIFYNGTSYAVAIGSDCNYFIICTGTLGANFSTDFPKAIAAAVV